MQSIVASTWRASCLRHWQPGQYSTRPWEDLLMPKSVCAGAYPHAYMCYALTPARICLHCVHWCRVGMRHVLLSGPKTRGAGCRGMSLKGALVSTSGQHASTTILALAVAGRCTCMLAGLSVAYEYASTTTCEYRILQVSCHVLLALHVALIHRHMAVFV